MKRKNSKKDRYSEFLRLCEHVECLVDLSVQKSGYQNNMLPSKALTRKTRKTLMKENEKGDKNIFLQNSRNTSIEFEEDKENLTNGREILLSDDLLVRSLRDANNLRSPLPLEGSTLQTFMQKHQNNPQNYYVWTELDKSRYRSRFFPMRKHDLVRDDMAFRSYRKNNSISSLEQDSSSNTKFSVAKCVSTKATSPKNDKVSLLLCQKDIYESQEVAVDVDEAIKRYKYDEIQRVNHLKTGAGSQLQQKSSVDGERHGHTPHFQNPNSPSSSLLQKVTTEADHHPHSILISSLPPIPPPRRRDRSRSKNRKENHHQRSPNSSEHSGKKSSNSGRNSQKAKSSPHSSARHGKHHQSENGKNRMKNNPIFPSHKLVVRHHSR